MAATINETEITRYIWKCRNKNCKHVWALEYIKRGSSAYRMVDGKQIWVSDDFAGDLRCPNCRRNLPDGNQVKGVYNEKHACNAKCMSSTSGVCSCSCGGKNHGIGHL